MKARALALGIWALLAITCANASEASQQRREQADVRAIFAMLLARIKPGVEARDCAA